MKAAWLVLAVGVCGAADAGLWRMYRCVGSEGETVFSDRSGAGTECREMWIETTKPDSSGWVITDSRVSVAEDGIAAPESDKQLSLEE